MHVLPDDFSDTTRKAPHVHQHSLRKLEGEKRNSGNINRRQAFTSVGQGGTVSQRPTRSEEMRFNLNLRTYRGVRLRVELYQRTDGIPCAPVHYRSVRANSC